MNVIDPSCLFSIDGKTHLGSRGLRVPVTKLSIPQKVNMRLTQ
jgi:hypothetical protein